jgi:enoyl-CoA hydratase/carnithine racemase
MTDFAEGSLRLSIDGRLATITLHQPRRRNAINLAMWSALPQLLDAVLLSPARVVILRGAGDHFAAGADISEFETVFADRGTAAAYADTMARGLDMLARFDLPTLAMIDGDCIGAGMSIALACDIRLAAVSARFAITPAKLGLMYSLADTKRLVDLVGPGVARDMLFTARIRLAADARAVGLIDEIHETAALEPAVAAKAQLIASNSPWSVRKAKSVIAMILDGVSAETEATRAGFADAFEGEDYREGLRAFREKRPPNFSGN